VIGVLETMDLAGLDLMYKGTKHLYPLIDRSLEPQRVLYEKVEKGELGVKTGKGFFTYDTAPGSSGGDARIKGRDRKLLNMLKFLR
jgi:3-hydroxybutyryl-CoA dehydrogenase